MVFTPILAGQETHPLVRDIGLCFLVAALLCLVLARFRIPTLAGFLAAGVLLGPEMTGLVSDRRNIETIANLGLVLLLFLIGLEIDLRKLLRSGRTLLLTGILQFPLCVAAGWAATAAVRAAGFDPAPGGWAPLYVGLTAAASSTLIVVKMMQERGQLDTVVGRISVGILIMQDMWAIVVLGLQPKLANPEFGPLALNFLGIAVLAALAFAVARWVLPVAFRWIAKVPEMILVGAAGWCFGIGFLGNRMGVSLEMGALIAGASLASLPFSTQVVSRVGVVHDFFITLFFVALGMQIPRPESWDPVILGLFLAGTCLALRALVFFPLLHVTGLDRRHALVASFRLAPLSEFCLVIAYLGLVNGHIGQEFVAGVIFAFVLLALAAPALYHAGDAIDVRLGSLLTRLGIRPPDGTPKEEAPAEAPEIVILGLHRTASSLLHEIETRMPSLRDRILILDFNVATHEEIRRRGFRVRYADFSDIEVLRHSGACDARLVISSVPDEILRGTDNLRLVKALRQISPAVSVVARATTFQMAVQLYAAGADYVHLQRLESAREIFAVVESALEGDLVALRAQQDGHFGPLASRSEILP
jgi:Kef-type K+ transport system membrane component KefB